MGLTHVTVRLRNFAEPNGGYEAEFLVDTGATDSLAPAAALRNAGIQPVGQTAYELANGRAIARNPIKVIVFRPTEVQIQPILPAADESLS